MKKIIFLLIVSFSFLNRPLIGAEVPTETVRLSNNELKTAKGKSLGDGVTWFAQTDSDGNRKDYIRLSPESQPVLFYTHNGGGITPILSHNKKYILILDYFADKAQKDLVEDLTSKNIWRIDEQAAYQYDREYAK